MLVLAWVLVGLGRRVKKSQDEPRCKEGSFCIYICRDGGETCESLSNVHAYYRRTRRIQVVHYYCGSRQAVDAVKSLFGRRLALDDHGQYVTAGVIVSRAEVEIVAFV